MELYQVSEQGLGERALWGWSMVGHHFYVFNGRSRRAGLRKPYSALNLGRSSYWLLAGPWGCRSGGCVWFGGILVSASHPSWQPGALVTRNFLQACRARAVEKDCPMLRLWNATHLAIFS